MLILLQLECFKQTTTILGQEQQSTLQLMLHPLENANKLCVASIDTESVAFIHFGTKSVQQTFTYTGEQITTVDFNLSTVRSDFTTIFNTDILSYQINLAGSLEVKGPIQFINLVKINVSNCWSDLQMIYDRVDGQEFIEMSGNPLLCSIMTPQIQFQYQLNNTWRTVDILGSNDGPEYYNKADRYVYSNIKFYKQRLSEVIDPDQHEILKSFFKHFQQNRTITVRFVFLFVEQQVIANINKLNSINQECIKTLNPSGFFTTRSIDIGLDNGDFFDNPNCLSDGAKFASQAFATTDIGVIYGGEIFYSKADFTARGGIQFDFQELLPNFELFERANFTIYVTLYDEDGVVLLESSNEFPAFVSCVDFVKTSISSFYGGCASINFYNNERCITTDRKTFNLTFTSELDGFKSRTTYFAYSLEFEQSAQIVQKCSKDLTKRIMGQNSTLPMNKRISFYSDIVRHRKGVFVALSNEIEFINIYECSLELNQKIWFGFAGICITVLISIGITITIWVKFLQ